MPQNDPFQQLYDQTMAKYHDYFEHVRDAFKAHCEQIKQRTMTDLAALPEEDKEGRKAVLMKQKEDLDKTLSELKQLLNYQSSQMRKALEDIRRQQEQESFNLETELAAV